MSENKQTKKLKDEKTKNAIKKVMEKAGIEKNDFKDFFEKIRYLYSKREIKEGEKLIVDYLLSNFKFKTPKDSRTIYVYVGGIYRDIGKVLIKENIQKILRTQNSNHATNEILGHIERSSYIEREDFIEPINKVCLKNGILNSESLTLEKFSPDYIFLNKIPVNYDKNKDCPKIKKFIREILVLKKDWNKDDKDLDLTDITTIQEFSGYLLLKDMRFNRALMLYGGGHNGKSTFINLIKEFLGTQNVCNVPIQKLEKDKFAIASLYGKLANLHSDLPKTALRETSMFKQLTGGDSVDGEKKFQDSFSFLNYAKMLYAANALPATPEDSIAFWRRWIIIQFLNEFPEDNSTTNKSLLKELTTEDELSGFLNWCIIGLKRLLKNQKFTMNKTTKQIREIYIRASDSVGAFILDCIEETTEAGKYIIKRDLYENYAQYCRDNNYNMLAENIFHRDFFSKVKVREFQPTVSRFGKMKQVKAWVGIKYKKNYKNNGKNNGKLFNE